MSEKEEKAQELIDSIKWIYWEGRLEGEWPGKERFMVENESKG